MAEVEASVEPAKNNEENLGFFARIWRFVRQVIDEMKKVVYPTGEELKRYFVVVIVFVAIIMALVGVVDLGFGALTDLIFSAIK